MPVPGVFEVLDDRALAARSRRFAGARWLTWSRPFRALLCEHRLWARLLEPAMIHLARAKEYSYTYTVTGRAWQRSAFGAAPPRRRLPGALRPPPRRRQRLDGAPRSRPPRTAAHHRAAQIRRLSAARPPLAARPRGAERQRGEEPFAAAHLPSHGAVVSG